MFDLFYNKVFINYVELFVRGGCKCGDVVDMKFFRIFGL